MGIRKEKYHKKKNPSTFRKKRISRVKVTSAANQDDGYDDTTSKIYSESLLSSPKHASELITKQIIEDNIVENRILNLNQNQIEEEHLVVINKIEEECSVTKPCGLFIDPDLPFLGASPDGLVDKDKVVEIKCPYSARQMSVEDGIKEKKITFWKIGKYGYTDVNKKHDWYFQAQGQLHVTRRKTCIFAVWTNVDIKIELIEEDKGFWGDMEIKLKMFYFDCLLPELIDSRLDRQMEIKEPNYILEAVKKREMDKNNKRRIVESETENKGKRIKGNLMS